MQSSWNCTILTMPWTGPGAWISWINMAWGQGPPPLKQVLGEAEDGGTDGRVLQITLTRRERRHPGQPTVAHHLQFGGGYGGSPQGIPGGGTGGGR